MRENTGSCFIAKPQKGSQGESIFIFRDYREFEVKVSSKHSSEYIVQRYVDQPLLMDGFKFDLRIYVAVFGFGSKEQKMHAFTCKEGLARFCTQRYQRPSKENLKNEYMHLTNYSINKASPDYKWEPEDILSPNDGSKRTLEAVWRELESNGVDVD